MNKFIQHINDVKDQHRASVIRALSNKENKLLSIERNILSDMFFDISFQRASMVYYEEGTKDPEDLKFYEIDRAERLAINILALEGLLLEVSAAKDDPVINRRLKDLTEKYESLFKNNGEVYWHNIKMGFEGMAFYNSDVTADNIRKFYKETTEDAFFSDRGALIRQLYPVERVIYRKLAQKAMETSSRIDTSDENIENYRNNISNYKNDFASITHKPFLYFTFLDKPIKNNSQPRKSGQALYNKLKDGKLGYNNSQRNEVEELIQFMTDVFMETMKKFDKQVMVYKGIDNFITNPDIFAKFKTYLFENARFRYLNITRGLQVEQHFGESSISLNQEIDGNEGEDRKSFGETVADKGHLTYKPEDNYLSEEFLERLYKVSSFVPSYIKDQLQYIDQNIGFVSDIHPVFGLNCLYQVAKDLKVDLKNIGDRKLSTKQLILATMIEQAENLIQEAFTELISGNRNIEEKIQLLEQATNPHYYNHDDRDIGRSCVLIYDGKVCTQAEYERCLYGLSDTDKQGLISKAAKELYRRLKQAPWNNANACIAFGYNSTYTGSLIKGLGAENLAQVERESQISITGPKSSLPEGRVTLHKVYKNGKISKPLCENSSGKNMISLKNVEAGRYVLGITFEVIKNAVTYGIDITNPPEIRAKDTGKVLDLKERLKLINDLKSSKNEATMYGETDSLYNFYQPAILFIDQDNQLFKKTSISFGLVKLYGNPTTYKDNEEGKNKYAKLKRTAIYSQPFELTENFLNSEDSILIKAGIPEALQLTYNSHNYKEKAEKGYLGILLVTKSFQQDLDNKFETYRHNSMKKKLETLLENNQFEDYKALKRRLQREESQGVTCQILSKKDCDAYKMPKHNLFFGNSIVRSVQNRDQTLVI